MKRITAILFIVLYSGLNIVSAVNLHYCHGKLVNFSINKPVESCCDSDLEIKATCCRNISIEVDIDNNQIVQNSLEVNSIRSILVLFTVLPKFNYSELLDTKPNNFISDSPPGKLHRSLFLLNNSFLFYG